MSAWSVTEMVSAVPRPLDLGRGRVLLATRSRGEFVGAHTLNPKLETHRRVADHAHTLFDSPPTKFNSSRSRLGA